MRKKRLQKLAAADALYLFPGIADLSNAVKKLHIQVRVTHRKAGLLAGSDQHLQILFLESIRIG